MRSLRTTLFLLLSAFLQTIAALAQHNPATDPPAPCDFKAADTPGKEYRLLKPDEKLNGDARWVSETTRRLDQVLQIVKDTFPGEKGFEANYYRVLAKNPNDTVGAYHIGVTMFVYRCVTYYDKASGKYVYTGEIKKPNLDSNVDTGSQSFYIHVGINSKQKLFARELRAHIDDHERTIVQTYPLVEVVDGFNVYGGEKQGAMKEMFIGRAGTSIYVPITRRQYVLATMEHFDEYYGASGRPGTGSFRGSFPEKDVELQRADMKRYLETTSEAELNKPAYTTGAIGYWYTPDPQSRTPRFEDELKPGVSEVMTQRTDYFHHDVPNYTPQMIEMAWEMQSVNEVSRIMEQRFLANFPARRLQAVLDK